MKKWFFSLLVALLLSGTQMWAQVQRVALVKEGGVLGLDVSVNGVSQRFVFDTGASMLTINKQMLAKMKSAGRISDRDFTGRISNFTLADGREVSGRELIIREVKFGNTVLTNVTAVLLDSPTGSLLFGQSVLARMKYHTIVGTTMEYEMRSAAEQKKMADCLRARDIYMDAHSAEQLAPVVALLKPYYDANTLSAADAEVLGLAFFYTDKYADAVRCLKGAMADHSFTPFSPMGLYVVRSYLYLDDMTHARAELDAYLRAYAISEDALLKTPSHDDSLGLVYYHFARNSLDVGDYDHTIRYARIAKNLGYVPNVQ